MIVNDKHGDGMDLQALVGDRTIMMECFEYEYGNKKRVALEFDKEQALEIRKALDNFIGGVGI